MPLYVYTSEEQGCPYCRERFEVMQRMNAEPLHECPRCGGPVHRVPAAFNPGQEDRLSDSNLQEKGFHRLRKADEATYEKEF